ncbi:hypothetical protein P8610_09560 [Fictibacillus sp. UD]
MIVVKGARLFEIELQIFFVRCVAAAAFLVLPGGKRASVTEINHFQ